MNKNYDVSLFPYEWKIEDGYPAKNIEKNNLKVFSCFACGGGSTMGYKLAGYDVIGCNEIDKKLIEIYKTNHNPKYAFCEPIQTFKNRDDLPEDLYNLDILDGSPPCSSFSMAGNREKDWGKNKVFREGQSKQVLDTLFFDFIDLANKLKPKVVIAENVKGLLLGNAKKYVNRILKEFDNSGYYVEYFLLDASTMGVPQKRERVFFIAIRKDLLKDKNYKYLHNELFSQNPYPYIDMKFNQKPIIYRDIRNPDNKEENLTEIQSNLWKLTKPGKSFSTAHIKGHFFNDKKLDIDKVPLTIRSSQIPFDCYVERRLSHDELCKAGSFPSDYNKVGMKSIIYIVGMSVPPVMMANIAHRVKKHIFDAILNKGCKQ